MTLYEMTYILRSDADDDAIKAVNDRIGARLKDSKGEVLKTEGWGRRRRPSQSIACARVSISPRSCVCPAVRFEASRISSSWCRKSCFC